MSCWSRRTTDHVGDARSLPLNSSVKPPPPPPVDPSGLNRIQSNCASGTDGARSESAAGPIFGSVKELTGAGRPTGLNVCPSAE